MSVFHFLSVSVAARDSLGGKAASDALAQGAGSILLLVSFVAWFVAWRLFKIEIQGRKYFFYNLAAAVIYLPFLGYHFYNCYQLNFTTGTEHYLMLFFLHAVVVLFWSIGFNGRNRQEESY
jgi:hypothetical protein